jgi:hypothetical protein
MKDIAEWLASIGLGEYAQRFAENRIDASVLRDLTDQDLEKIGLPRGHRRKILRAIAELDGLATSPIDGGRATSFARTERAANQCTAPSVAGGHFWVGGGPNVGHEAAGVRSAARRRGGVAGRWARPGPCIALNRISRLLLQNRQEKLALMEWSRALLAS